MSFSTELHEWGVAIKELVQESKQKHPFVFWLVLIVAFIYAFTKMFIR